MFYDNFIGLCKQNGETATSILKELGLSYGNLSNWKNGAKVNSDILLAVSEHFNVSVDYLLTGKERESGITLTPNEQECLNWFSMLTETDQGRILERMQMMYEGYTPEVKEAVS